MHYNPRQILAGVKCLLNNLSDHARAHGAAAFADGESHFFFQCDRGD